MSQQGSQFESEEESRQTVHVLSTLIWVTWAGYLITIISGLFWTDWFLIRATLISSVLLVIPFWQLKRGQITNSAYLLVGMVLGTITMLATLGHGSHDFAIMAYPIVIIYARLVLNRVGFRICVLLTIAALAWLVFGNMNGLFISKPFERPSAVDFLILAAILSISVLAIDLLVTSIRKNLAMAHSEILRRKQIEEVLREKEVQFRNLADSGTALIWMAGTDKLCNYFNVPWLKFTGRTLEQELGNGWAVGVHPDDFDRCLTTYNAAFEKHEAFDMDYRIRHVSGEFRWIQDLGTPNYDSNGEFIGYIGHCFDITARKQAEDKFRMLFELSPIGLAMVDNATGEFLEVNKAVLQATGYTQDEFLKLSYWDITPREYEAQEMKQLQDLKETGRFGPNEKEYIRKDGTRYPISISGALFIDQNERQVVWGIIEDITERKQAEEQLRFQGTHDILTGIYNRTFFEAELARLENSRDFPISIVVADVDKLKVVNDTRGHAVGDELLRRVSKVLSSVFREGDILARIGGDEFAVLLPGANVATAEKMLARAKMRVAQQNSDFPDLPVQLSLGMATAEKGGLTSALMLADQQMYADKAERAAVASVRKM